MPPKRGLLINPIVPLPSTTEDADKDCKLFEPRLGGASFYNPGSFEEHRASRTKCGTAGHGCPFFWFVFFGQAKKMNRNE